jgi:hypothetical protein
VQDKVRVAQVRGHPGRANPPAPGRMSISQNDNPHSTILPGRASGTLHRPTRASARCHSPQCQEYCMLLFLASEADRQISMTHGGAI